MNILGIDLGGTKILGVRADEHGNVLAEKLEPTQADQGFEAVLDRLLGIIRDLTPSEGVDAIGIDVPGPADPYKGIVYSPPNLPGWSEEGVPLLQLLRDKLGYDDDFPLMLANDANAAALAEYKFGAGTEKRMGKKIKHLVYLTVSTGIGGGVVIDGKLLLGANGFAAELGHVVIDVYGYRCHCGNVGCLEAMASGTALKREAELLDIFTQAHQDSRSLAEGDPDKASARIVVQAAQEGDPLALDLMEREGMLVGVGCVNFIHTFNPQVIVIGGGVSNAGDLLFKPLRATVEKGIMPAYKGTYDIVPAVLRDKSAALGSVAVALAELDERRKRKGLGISLTANP